MVDDGKKLKIEKKNHFLKKKIIIHFVNVKTEPRLWYIMSY
jgi:hypothetical protein